ncbi:hypothetical protein LNP05_15335 [Klebsiella pneumoniae subsp. pneumoniae]|nr:hypothetical protein [Klebsiella pneumoniae subsp. pneumoniae]
MEEKPRRGSEAAEPGEWKTYIDSRNTGNFDVIRASWVGDYNEPSTFLSLLTSTHSGNISRFNDPAYDKILAQAAVENSAKARNDDYNAAEKIIMVKAPIAPIYQYTNGRLIAVAERLPDHQPGRCGLQPYHVYREALTGRGCLKMSGNHRRTPSWRVLPRQFFLISFSRHSRKSHFSGSMAD